MIWRKVLWVVGFALIGLGCFTVFAGNDLKLVATLRWDPSMVGIGVAVIAIGLFYLDKVITKKGQSNKE